MAVPLTEDGCMCEEVRVASRSTRCEESVRHPIECRLIINNKVSYRRLVKAGKPTFY